MELLQKFQIFQFTFTVKLCFVGLCVSLWTQYISSLLAFYILSFNYFYKNSSLWKQWHIWLLFCMIVFLILLSVSEIERWRQCAGLYILSLAALEFSSLLATVGSVHPYNSEGIPRLVLWRHGSHLPIWPFSHWVDMWFNLPSLSPDLNMWQLLKKKSLPTAYAIFVRYRTNVIK